MDKASFSHKSTKATANLTLRDILKPLFRYRRIAIIAFGSVFVCTTLVAWVWAANYYKSTMQVLVEEDRSDPAISAAQNGAVYNNKVITTDLVTSEVSLLQGEDMLRTVASTCGLDSRWSLGDFLLPSDPTLRKGMKRETAARALLRKIKVEAPPSSDVIDVSFGRMGEPEVPACVLQTLSKLYLEKHLQLQRPAGSSDVFADQTDKYRRALAESETHLTDFSRKEGVAAPDLLRSDMALQVATTEAGLYQARQAVAADEERIRNLKVQMATVPERSSTSEVSNSANLLMQNLQTALLAAEVKRTQLLVKYAPEYPLVQEVDQEIAETREAIVKAEQSKYVNRTTDRDPTYELLREDEAKTEADLASHQATVTALSNNVRNMNLEMVKLDAQAVQQNALLREAKVNEGNYLLNLTKREQEATSDALDKKSIANVAIAVAPVVPLLPAHSPWLVMFLGFMVAIVIGMAAAFVAEYLDPSFRNSTEVVDVLNIPILASVPRRAA
jgi:uncharacterized protein involved in exopolysaccharide biosynthesis